MNPTSISKGIVCALWTPLTEDGGIDEVDQLYDLSVDPGELTNLATTEPARVKSMSALLEKVKADGRSR